MVAFDVCVLAWFGRLSAVCVLSAVGRVTVVLAMAALPRWVDSPRVDSRAMFGAYLHYVRGCQDQEELLALSHLYSIEHYPYVGNAGPWRACTQPFCTRCTQGKGGYRFRWYDRRWDTPYCAMARPGAWLPTEDLDYDAGEADAEHAYVGPSPSLSQKNTDYGGGTATPMKGVAMRENLRPYYDTVTFTQSYGPQHLSEGSYAHIGDADTVDQEAEGDLSALVDLD